MENLGEAFGGINDIGLLQSRLKLIELRIIKAHEEGADDDIDDLIATKHRIEGRMETLNAA